jgi:hypothetical protein
MVQQISDKVANQKAGKKNFSASVFQVQGHSPGNKVNSTQTENHAGH